MRFADPDGALERAAGPHGDRRFYPPEGNPKTHRLREELFRLERHREEVVADGLDASAMDEAIEHCRRQIRLVDVGCDIEKARFLLHHYDRSGV